MRMNADLKTRVKELEFTNELYQGRVLQLEASVAEQRSRADALEIQLNTLKSVAEDTGSNGNSGKRKSDAMSESEESVTKKSRVEEENLATINSEEKKE